MLYMTQASERPPGPSANCQHTIIVPAYEQIHLAAQVHHKMTPRFCERCDVHCLQLSWFANYA